LRITDPNTNKTKKFQPGLSLLRRGENSKMDWKDSRILKNIFIFLSGRELKLPCLTCFQSERLFCCRGCRLYSCGNFRQCSLHCKHLLLKKLTVGFIIIIIKRFVEITWVWLKLLESIAWDWDPIAILWISLYSMHSS